MRILVALLLLLAHPAFAQKAGEPGRFDYYLLALSWSPSWCAADLKRESAPQCGAGRRFGFVVHGLWPQYEAGGYPAQCARPGKLPEPVFTEMLPIMPSRALIGHQWRKHGTCQGDDAAAYFAQIRAARERIRIPGLLAAPVAPVRLDAALIPRLFAEANPGLPPDGLAVVCRDGRLAEVRICLDRGLDFRRCASDVRSRCRGDIVIPAVR